MQRIPLRILILFLIFNNVEATMLTSSWNQRNLKEYESGIVTLESFEGDASAYIKSRDVENVTKGSLWQGINVPENWIGKRIKLTAYIKSLNIEYGAGMYMRVYADNGDIYYDYMRERMIRGSNKWNNYKVVLDIPFDANIIGFGVWIEGRGEIQVDKFEFTIVDTSEEVTGKIKKRKYDKPKNLDFEDFLQSEPVITLEEKGQP